MLQSTAQSGTRTQVRGTLLGQVLGLLAFSMVFTAAGAFVAPRLGGRAFTIGGLGALITWVVLFFAHRLPPMLRLGVFYLFSVFQGLTLGGVVNNYIAAGQGDVVTLAAATTAGVVLALGGYAWTTKRDLSGWGSYLLVGLIGVLLASIAGIFIRAPLFHVGLAAATAVVFGGYLMHHVQQMRASSGDAIGLAIATYIDILNLFWAIFRLLNYARRSG